MQTSQALDGRQDRPCGQRPALACQTWIEGTFVREFTQSPVGPLPPNSQRVSFDIHNIFQFDDEGRFVNDYVRLDNRSVLEQLGYKP